jgi:hypothetical protein
MKATRIKPSTQLKQLSDAFTNHNGVNKWDALLPLLSNLALKYASRKFQENQHKFFCGLFNAAVRI